MQMLSNVGKIKNVQKKEEDYQVTPFLLHTCKGPPPARNGDKVKKQTGAE